MSALYHYSIEKHDKLLTRRKQGIASPEEIAKAELRAENSYFPGPYVDHISFFLEPVPLDIIAKCFKGQHPFWKSGVELIEHTVYTSELKDFQYHIVESPMKTAIYDSMEIASDDDRVLEKYFKALKDIQECVLERGNNVVDLLEIQKFLKGKTRQCYVDLPLRKDFEDIKEKYAATVPHVMLYPESGYLWVDKFKKVKVK